MQPKPFASIQVGALLQEHPIPFRVDPCRATEVGHRPGSFTGSEGGSMQ